jgi:hypothetical protein
MPKTARLVTMHKKHPTVCAACLRWMSDQAISATQRKKYLWINTIFKSRAIAAL